LESSNSMKQNSEETAKSGQDATTGQKPQRLKAIAVNICRLLLAATFLFSGFVKAVDPHGTQYKLADYAEAWHVGSWVSDFLLLCTSVALSAFEFCIGICLIFAIHRRLASRLALLFMLFMTALTLWIFIDNPVSDCGCFGDAVKLTNGETFAKNIVLTACAVVVAWRPLLMARFISKTNQWIVLNYSMLFIIAVALWSLYALPLFDFRPYHVGADIRKGMEIPEGAPQPEFETRFILEKNGEQREFTIDDYPDSTWTFIDSKTTEIKAGYVPPIHDFSIERRDDGTDITAQVVDDSGYTWLLIATYLEKADDSQLDQINGIYEYSQEMGYPFYCLTASGEAATQRWTEMTGAEYPYCTTDAITLKTIIRSNPGLVLLKDGKVIGKWSHNQLPEEKELRDKDGEPAPLDQLAIGKINADSVAGRLTVIMLWYVLPLLLLTFADRLWALRKVLIRRKKSSDK